MQQHTSNIRLQTECDGDDSLQLMLAGGTPFSYSSLIK